MEIVDFRGIRTLIIGLGGNHGNHYSTIATCYLLYLFLRVKECDLVIKIILINIHRGQCVAAADHKRSLDMKLLSFRDSRN